MRTLTGILLLLATVLLLSAPVQATGYKYHDGYYWKGYDAYTRTLYTEPGYYYYGCYYPGRSYYTYSYSHTYQAPVTPTVNYTDPGWRSKLLDIAAQRDKAEAELRKGAFEQAYFSEAVKQLGLQGNFRWEGYGLSPPYANYGVPYAGHAGYGQLQLSTAGTQGSTLYGYSYNSIGNVYGSSNLDTLYQSANRLAENAQKLAGQATQDFGQLVGQEGSNRARVAEILAKSQAVHEMLRAMEGSGAKLEQKTFSFKVEPGPNGQMQLQRVEQPNLALQAVPELRKQWEIHARAKCFDCHNPGQKKGGFDVTEYSSLTPERKMEVMGRILTNDEGKRMPRKADGGAGPRLGADEVKLWLLN